MSMERFHNMKAVALRTGLSAHLIRVWERRYAAVTPARSGTQRRLYSEAEVERLQLLARLSQSGLAIGQIAGLATEQLRQIAEREAGPGLGERVVEELGQEVVDEAVEELVESTPGEMVEAALRAIRSYDMVGLESILDQGMITFGYAGLLEKGLVPLLHAMGSAWAAGELTAAQEHGATAALKDYLARNLRSMQLPGTAPRLLVTTPAGQLHEMGAAIVAGLARKAGWQVFYLGASLPAEEIVGAAVKNQIRAVALSIVYPGDDPELPGQLRRLRRLLPEGIPIVVGGQAAEAYGETLREIGAHLMGGLEAFPKLLLALRSGGAIPAREGSAGSA